MMRFAEFKGPRGTLRGALHLPTGTGPAPGVVMFHGFGAHRMEYKFEYVTLSRRLEAAGIASLRFDFYGSGESDGTFREMTISGERADAMVALDWFKGLGEIDAARVGLLGMSMGGLVAACTLGSRPDVKAACLWAPAARKRGETPWWVSDEVQRQAREQGWIDRDGRQLGVGFFDDWPKHEPYEEIVRYPGPVLVIHGTGDESVPIEKGREYVRVLEGRAGAVTEHLFIEGADHPWGRVEWRETLYETTVEWFKTRL